MCLYFILIHPHDNLVKYSLSSPVYSCRKRAVRSRGLVVAQLGRLAPGPGPAHPLSRPPQDTWEKRALVVSGSFQLSVPFLSSYVMLVVMPCSCDCACPLGAPGWCACQSPGLCGVPPLR